MNNNTNDSFSKYAIIGYGRTRSSYLVSLLNNHPELACMGEVFMDKFFSDDAVKRLAERQPNTENSLDAGFLSKFRNEDPVGYMNFIFESMAKEKPVVGFKIFPDQNDQAMAHILANKEIKKIILVRNFLFSFVSLNQSFASEKWFAKKGEKIELPKIEFNMNRFTIYLNKRVNNLRYILNELDSTGQKYLVCFSEDIGNADWWGSVCDFLGVSLNIEASTHYTKLNPNHLDERVSNYNEMVKLLLNTNYYTLLFGDFFPDRENWLQGEISNRKPSMPKTKQAVKESELHSAEIVKLQKRLNQVLESRSYKLGYSLTRIPALIYTLFRRKPV